MKKILATVICCSLLLVICSADLRAKIYRYVDEKGTTVFVDDESKIPLQYRPKTSKIYDETKGMSAEEIKTYEKNKQLEQERETKNQRKAKQDKARELSKKAKQTKVKVEENMVIVPVKMRHGNSTAKLNLLLDTGASETIVYYPALERFRFRRGELGLAQLAGGYVIPTVKVKFYKVEIGPFVQKYMPITVIDSVNPDSPFDGLLGMDFLMKHKYDIDYEGALITWKD